MSDKREKRSKGRRSVVARSSDELGKVRCVRRQLQWHSDKRVPFGPIGKVLRCGLR